MYSTLADEEYGAVKYLGRGICVTMAVVERRNVFSLSQHSGPSPEAGHGVGHKHIKHSISGQNKDSKAVCRWDVTDVSLFQNFNPDRFYGSIFVFTRRARMDKRGLLMVCLWSN